MHPRDTRKTLRTFTTTTKFNTTSTIGYNHITKLTDRSSHRLFNIVEKFAYFFKREHRYDFVQFCSTEDREDEDCRAFIFSDDQWSNDYEMTHFGAACFRYRKYENVDKFWALQWIWLHPFYRDKGILQSFWPFFCLEFNNKFDVEAPYSKAMAAFLNKMNHTMQKGESLKCEATIPVT